MSPKTILLLAEQKEGILTTTKWLDPAMPEGCFSLFHGLP